MRKVSEREKPMTVHVTPVSGRGSHAAEITWTANDDQHGYVTAATQGDQLASALTALGAAPGQAITDRPETLALIARHTRELTKLLERRTAGIVVQLRDKHGLSWPDIAERVLGDKSKHSTIVRMYDSGRRHLGH